MSTAVRRVVDGRGGGAELIDRSPQAVGDRDRGERRELGEALGRGDADDRVVDMRRARREGEGDGCGWDAVIGAHGEQRLGPCREGGVDRPVRVASTGASALDEEITAVGRGVEDGHPPLVGLGEQRPCTAVDECPAVVAEHGIEDAGVDVPSEEGDGACGDADRLRDAGLSELDEGLDRPAGSEGLIDRDTVGIVQVQHPEAIHSETFPALLRRAPDAMRVEGTGRRIRVDLGEDAVGGHRAFRPRQASERAPESPL